MFSIVTTVSKASKRDAYKDTWTGMETDRQTDIQTDTQTSMHTSRNAQYIFGVCNIEPGDIEGILIVRKMRKKEMV